MTYALVAIVALLYYVAKAVQDNIRDDRQLSRVYSLLRPYFSDPFILGYPTGSFGNRYLNLTFYTADLWHKCDQFRQYCLLFLAVWIAFDGLAWWQFFLTMEAGKYSLGFIFWLLYHKLL